MHLRREIDSLKSKILALSASVEENVRRAVSSFTRKDAALAERIIQSDVEVDNAEVDVEEECLKILALHQPVAADLRFIVAVLKINNDIERIGDLAVNIAERARSLATMPGADLGFDIPGMASRAQSMLRESLDALVNLDVAKARKVCGEDDAVDAMHARIYSQAKDIVVKDPKVIEVLLPNLSVARNLERIADHATNIAEDVIYMVDGAIVRHHRG
ncbi:MAG: phosphate signaling complex protein PhoU [Planctomycetota bacterium]